MSVWAELKRVVNDNFSYPLNKQHFYPVNFNTTAEWFEASTTYTVPQTGVYIVTCVGKGGNADSTAESSTHSYNSGWTVSGGGGAVCKGYVILTAGQTIYITIDTSQSNFGNLIAAGAGANGLAQHTNYGQPAAASGGAVLIAGNIFNHAGYYGPVINVNYDNPGGNAGVITPYSLNDGWSQGYLPLVNFTELTGGEGANANNGYVAQNGKFGGGKGGNVAHQTNLVGVRGGGGYGAGGNWNRISSSTSHTGMYASGSGGGKGVVIVEHGVIIYG